MLCITIKNMPINQLNWAMEHDFFFVYIKTASRILYLHLIYALFSATLQNVAYTCLYSPSPSWALNCLADLWLGKRWGTSGCIRMQNIAVTAGARANLCVCVCECVRARVCARIELFQQVPHHKERTLQRCLCWVVSLWMFTVALCFFVSAPLLLPRLVCLCLAQFSLWCNTSLLQHQLFLILLLIVSLSFWPECIPTLVATLLGFYPLLFPSPPHSVFFHK